MQHTETLNLNLIQPDDTFSPDPLNENAQALETALSAEAAARNADVAALDARIVKLEGKHFASGLFHAVGEGNSITLTLGFTPVAVFILASEGRIVGFIHRDYNPSGFHPGEIIPGGFKINRFGQSGGINALGYTAYLAVD